MPQDAFTLRIACKELNTLLAGGKINKINQPTADEVIINVYTGGKTVNLCISANAQSARVCPTKAEKQNPTVAPNFCMLLRKHLSGAIVLGVECVGYERIVKIVFEAKNDFREQVEKCLICEIMGKYSNAILVEDGKILGTLKPSFSDLNAVRTTFIGCKYTLPPSQDKFEISNKTCVLGAFSEFTGGNVTGLITSTVQGVSTKTAEEIAFRFFGKSDVDLWDRQTAEKLYNFISEFLDGNETNANVLLLGGKGDFYATDYKSVSGEKLYFPTLLDAETYYFDKFEGEKNLRSRIKTIEDKLKAHEKKLKKRLQLLTEREISCEDAEQNKIKGELLTAYQYGIKPGSKVCELPSFYSETGELIKIALDPDLSANENAQNYFKKYQKQKKTLSAVQPQKAEVTEELDYLKDLFAVLYTCEKPADFECLSEELKQAKILKEQTKQKKKSSPSLPRMFVLGDFLIKVGRNNLQNDTVTFTAARDDLWLHTKAFHSAHLIIETAGREVPDEVLVTAAEICAHYSEAKGQDKVPVDYCLKKFVKKPPKARPGGVIYTDFKTVLVTANPHADKLKK